MNVPDGYAAEITVPFTDADGSAITPTGVSARLFDGVDALLMDFGLLAFNAADGSKTITIPAAVNDLADDETRAVRRLEVLITHDAGNPITKTQVYIVEAEQSLSVMVNTFQSYEAADLLAGEVVNTAGWTAAAEPQRRAALIEAFRRITSIPMRYGIRDENGDIDPYDLHYIPRDLWPEVTADAYRAFPSHFQRALRKAQFIEANELLQGDTIGARRRAGVISETIGESSMTLRRDQIDYGLSHDTLAALTGYIDYNMRIARA